MTARVALVTGAARGIGAATCRRLAAQGYAVLATDWCAGADAAPYPMPTEADLAAVARTHDGVGQIETLVADVREGKDMAAAVATALERWGRLDVAVAAAGIIAGGQPMWETPAAELDLLWQVDAVGVWLTASEAIPAMLAGPDPSGCRFVAVASAAGHRGLFHLAAYNAAKHAVVGMVRGLAADLVGTGVTAAAVSPGSTDTAMLTATSALYPGSDEADLAGHQLLRRPLDSDEVAATIVHCCSIEGAAVNGSVVHADGGFGG